MHMRVRGDKPCVNAHTHVCVYIYIHIWYPHAVNPNTAGLKDLRSVHTDTYIRIHVLFIKYARYFNHPEPNRGMLKDLGTIPMFMN